MNNKRRLKSVTKADSELSYREINPERLYSNLESPYSSNKIRSYPYTLLTLIPKTLLEEYQKQISYFWFTLIIFFSFYLDIQSFSFKWYILIVFLILLLSPLFTNFMLMIKRKASDIRINRAEANLWKPFKFTPVTCGSLQVGDVILVNMFDEVPADILLLASKEGKKVQIMMNQNLGREEVVEKRTLENFRINKELNHDDIFANLKKFESLSVIAPNKSFEKFKAKIRFKGNPKTYTADSQQFVIGGSRIVGNEWVLGMVVYTGFDTKIWINSTMWSGSRTSKMLMAINFVHLILFAIIVVLVLVTVSMWSMHPSSFENFSTGESIMWNTVMYGNLISVSLLATMKLARIISAIVIRLKTGDISISYRILQELGKVEYIVAEKNELVCGEDLKLTAFGIGDKFYYKEISDTTKGTENHYKIIHPNSSLELLPEYLTFEDLEIAAKSDKSSNNLQEFLFSVFFTSQKIKDICIQLRKEDKNIQKAVKALGLTIQSQTCKDISLKFNDAVHKFTIIGECAEGTSNSILVKSDSGKYFLFSKFDLCSMETIPGGDNFVSSFKINFHSDFKGVFYAYKPLSQRDGEIFSFNINLALRSAINSEGKLKQTFEKHSKDLTFLGFLGFEYRKIEKISKTVTKLQEVGIKTWVVSGDSWENSILACYSSKLFTKSTKINNLTGLSTIENCVSALNQILKEESNPHNLYECRIDNLTPISRLIQRKPTLRGVVESSLKESSPMISPLPLGNREATVRRFMRSKSVKPSIEAKLPKIEEIDLVQYNLVVDSASLNTLLSSKETRKLFVIVLFLARSVCFCGLTPDQKLAVIQILKNNISFRPTVMALSGQNTNSMMLNEACISVKIQDSLKKCNHFETFVSIPDFSKLVDIILIHGHYSYARLSRVFHFSLYRECLVCIILFLYEFHSGFSSAYIFDIDLFVAFEIFVSFFPLLLVGIFDKDVSDQTAKNSSAVYAVGYFNFLASKKRWIFYCCTGLSQGIIMYVILFYGFGNIVNSKGFTEDSEVFGTLFFVVISLSFVQNIVMTTQKFYFPTILSPILTIGFIVLCVGLTYSGKFTAYNNSQEILLDQGRFWVLVLTLPLLFSGYYFMLSSLYFKFFRMKFKNRLQMFKDSLEEVYKESDIWKENPKSRSFKINKKALKFESANQELEYQLHLGSRFTKFFRTLAGIVFVVILIYVILLYTGIIASFKYQQYTAIPAVVSFIFLLFSMSMKVGCERLIVLFMVFVLTIFVFDSLLNISSTMLRYPVIEVLFSICFNLRWKTTIVQTIITYIVSVFIFTYETIVYDSSTAGVSIAYCITLNLGIMALCLVITYLIDYSRRVEYTYVEKAKKQFTKSNEILGYLSPEFVKKRVNDGVRYIAEDKGVVTVIFCDICEFDKIVEDYTSSEIVLLLDEFFSRIDKICEIVGVSKIETVGKTYMACSGLKDFDYDLNSNINEISHPRRAIEMAFAVIQEAEKTLLKNGEGLKMKIGIHSGSVIAGVVGYHKPQFSLVGDTVNTASRMASTLEFYNKIQMTLETFSMLEDHSGLHFTNNYPVVKGKGEMRTLLVEPARKSTEDLIEKRQETRESTGSALQIKSVDSNKRRGTVLGTEIKSKSMRFQCDLSFKEKFVQVFCVETQAEKEFHSTIHKKSYLMQYFGLLTSAVINFAMIIIASVEVSLEMKYSSTARLSILCVEELSTILFLIFLKKIQTSRLTAFLLNTLYWLEIVAFFILEFNSETNFTMDMLFYYFHYLLLNFCTGLFFLRNIISNASLITILIVKIFYFSPALENYFFAIFFVICVLTTTYIRESGLRADHIIRYILNEENEKTELLLTQMLPSKALKNLQEEVIDTDKLSAVTIMYADIVGFTAYSAQRSPAEVIGMLSELFTRFDKMCVEFGIYKVYTIGDCYVAMGYNGGAKRNAASEAKQMALFAFSLINLIQEVNERIGGGLDMRIGMHTGDITGGMNGTGIIRYDIYGKDVMIANKMESNGVPGKINVSESTKELLEGFAPGEFSFEYLKNVKAWDLTVKTYLISRNMANNLDS